MDHLVPPNDETDNREPCFESYTTLAAAAQITDRVRLGCLVTANTLRHPALLAKMAATIDHISDGRLNLALGAGWNEFEHEAYGIPLPSVRERQDRLEEAAQILRLFFAAEKPVSFDGRYYRLKDAPFAPGFVQKPHPPLWIGGGGEKRTLRTVARYADVANVLGPVSVVLARGGRPCRITPGASPGALGRDPARGDAGGPRVPRVRHRRPLRGARRHGDRLSRHRSVRLRRDAPPLRGRRRGVRLAKIGSPRGICQLRRCVLVLVSMGAIGFDGWSKASAACRRRHIRR